MVSAAKPSAAACRFGSVRLPWKSMSGVYGLISYFGLRHFSAAGASIRSAWNDTERPISAFRSEATGFSAGDAQAAGSDVATVQVPRKSNLAAWADVLTPYSVSIERAKLAAFFTGSSPS